MPPKTIHKRDHHNECFAVKAVEEGTWDSPWYIRGESFGGDKRGNQTGQTYRWFKVRCNDPSCPAMLYVSVEWLETVVFEEDNAKKADKS